MNAVEVVQKGLIKNMKDFHQGGVKILLASDTPFRMSIENKHGDK